MTSKLMFLTKISLNKKIKTKWFLIANLIFAILIIGLLNIDSVIKFFGGDFDDTQEILVIDEVGVFDNFKYSYEEGSKYLSDIKKDYKKKNIIVSGDIDLEVLKKQDGVREIKKINDEYIISINDDSYVKSLFKCISKFDNIVKFSVEDPSLNEIFISIVGDSYDK